MPERRVKRRGGRARQGDSGLRPYPTRGTGLTTITRTCDARRVFADNERDGSTQTVLGPGQSGKKGVQCKDGTWKLALNAEKILIARNKAIHFTDNHELQKRQVEGVPASRRPGRLRRHGDRPAIGQVIRKQFPLVFTAEFELRISEHADKFARRSF